MAHLVFSDTRANAQKTKRAIFFQRSTEQSKQFVTFDQNQTSTKIYNDTWTENKRIKGTSWS